MSRCNDISYTNGQAQMIQFELHHFKGLNIEFALRLTILKKLAKSGNLWEDVQICFFSRSFLRIQHHIPHLTCSVFKPIIYDTLAILVRVSSSEYIYLICTAEMLFWINKMIIFFFRNKTINTVTLWTKYQNSIQPKFSLITYLS